MVWRERSRLLSRITIEARGLRAEHAQIPGASQSVGTALQTLVELFPLVVLKSTQHEVAHALIVGTDVHQAHHQIAIDGLLMLVGKFPHPIQHLSQWPMIKYLFFYLFHSAAILNPLRGLLQLSKLHLR